MASEPTRFESLRQDGLPRGLTEELKKCVLPLLAVTDEAHWKAIGTCFVVAVLDAKNAIAITATHNLRYSAQISPRYRSRGSALADFVREPTWAEMGVELYAQLRDAGRVDLAMIVRDYYVNEHDVALLWLRLPGETQAGFSSSLPLDVTPFNGSGVTILVAGYPQMTVRSHVDFDRQIFRVEMNTPISYAHGTIESFSTGGTPLVKSPGVFLSCKLPFGMSGGPVMELRGSTPIVRAVASSDVTGTSHEPRPFASHPLPIAALPLVGLPRLHCEDGEELENPTLVDLAAKGLVKDPCNSFKHINSKFDGNTLTVTWSGPALQDE